MLAAALLIAMYPDWVPARWQSGDPKSLDLLAGTPINCLWIERPQWSATFAAEAAKRGIATLGVIRPEGDPMEAARALTKNGFTGGVIEGAFDDYSLTIIGGTLAKANMFHIEAGPRSRMHFDAAVPIVATSQGFWPGIHVDKGGSATAGPTENPWIDTNTGFIRFARASTTATIWIAVSPPDGNVYPIRRYLQAIGDAAINGARWVVSIDKDFSRRLLAREPKALKDWAQIGAALRHFEEHPEWRAAKPAGKVAVIQDDVEARLSGGLFDMLAAKQIPAVALPYQDLSAGALAASRLAVNAEPDKVPADRTAALRSFAQAGGTVVDGPPESKARAAKQAGDDFVYDPANKSAETIWVSVAEVIGRQNYGVRLFNVANMLSNLTATAGQRQIVLHLVNYSEFAASGITAHVAGVYQRARLFRPGEAPVDLEIEKVPEGTSLSIDQRISTIATVVLE